MKYWIADTNNSIMFVCWLYIIIPYDCPQVASKSNIVVFAKLYYYGIADTNNSILFQCWVYIIMPNDCPQVTSEWNIVVNCQIRLLDTLLFKTLKHTRYK